VNHVTTEVITATVAICPETSGVFTLTKTLTCAAHDSACGAPGATKTTALTVTVTPLAPSDQTTHVVPGCTPGAPGPSVCVQCAPATPTATTLVVAPTAKCTANCGVPSVNGTVTAAGPKATKPVTAGAAKMGWASGVVAVVGGGLLMAVLGL
jgi:hypothetical protein